MVDSLRAQLKTVVRDTNRSNILTAIIKATRIDYPDTAILYCKQAHELATELHDNVRIAGSFNLLGTAYYYRADYALAEEMQRKSLKVCDQFGLRIEKANSLGSLALALQAQSKYSESIETYYEALKSEEDNHNLRGLAKLLNNLGILYRNLGDYTNSLKHAHRAYRVMKDSLSDWETAIASAANNIGLSYLDVQQYDSAILFLKESYRLNDKLKNLTFTANSASNISYCYVKQNKIDSAVRYIDVAYQLLPKISNQSISAAVLINLGGARFMQNRLDEALRYTQQGLELARAAKTHERKLDAYKTLAEIFNKRNDDKQAYKFLNLAYQLNDSLKVIQTQRQAANLQRDYEIKKKQQSIDILGKEAFLREAKLKNEQQVRVYLIFSIILLVITAGATYYGFRQKIKSNKRLKAHSDEIAHKNELLESVNRSLQDQAMRSQMKPHFIFNALNSIQFLILQKENDKAFDYLSKFSQLLRSVLEFSDRDFIELDKELKWLELYVQIEALRFNQGFDFKVENSLHIEETARINVPPFLIQPFLENAIAHGLMTKSADRLLTLKIYQQNSHINISIADNGIGREASARLKTGNGKKHRSFAMDLVGKRLEILKAITGKEFTWIVTDGVNAIGEKEGTVVKLQLPG